MTTLQTLRMATVIQPDEFEAHKHWYPKALNATIHPMINFFLNLQQERIITRYCHLHPTVNADKLQEILQYKCKYFAWGGADLLNVTSAGGKRQISRRRKFKVKRHLYRCADGCGFGSLR